MTGDHHQPPLPAPDHDGDRFTPALAADVQVLLTQHGYRMPADTAAQQRALTNTLAALAVLVGAFEDHTTTVALTDAQCEGWACATCGRNLRDTASTAPAGHLTIVGLRWQVWRCATCPPPPAHLVEDAR